MVKHIGNRRFGFCKVNGGTIVGQDGSFLSSAKIGVGIYQLTRTGGPGWASNRVAIFVQPTRNEGEMPVPPPLLHQVVRVDQDTVEVRLTDDAGAAEDGIFCLMMIYLT